MTKRDWQKDWELTKQATPGPWEDIDGELIAWKVIDGELASSRPLQVYRKIIPTRGLVQTNWSSRTRT